MTNKEELKKRKARCIEQKHSKESELKSLQGDKKRLQDAVNSAQTIIEDFNSEKKTYDGIEIEKNQWSGQTRNKSDDNRTNLNTSIDKYKEKFDKAINQMKKDLENLESKIEGVETDISNIAAEIQNIDSQL